MVTQTSKVQLAQWIKAGLALPNVVEVDDSFGSRDGFNFCGCALFCCLAGKEGNAAAAYEKYLRGTGKGRELFAKELGINLDLAQNISHAHCCRVSASEIANRLEKEVSLVET